MSGKGLSTKGKANGPAKKPAKRDYERALKIIMKQVQKFNYWGLPTALVYTTKTMALSTYGSLAISNAVKSQKDTIYRMPDFSKCTTLRERQLHLPKIDIPLEKWKFHDLRTLAHEATVASVGLGMRSQIGWGEKKNKPQWWPEHVAWTKRGVQEGVSSQDLRDIIRACYVHHGEPLTVYVSINCLQIVENHKTKVSPVLNILYHSY